LLLFEPVLADYLFFELVLLQVGAVHRERQVWLLQQDRMGLIGVSSDKGCAKQHVCVFSETAAVLQ
jgi:hypothetical protein